MQETQVRSLGREDPLEEGTAIQSIHAWKIPWTKEPGRLQSMVAKSDFTFTFFFFELNFLLEKMPYFIDHHL